MEDRFNSKDQKQYPTDTGEQNVESGKSRTIVDKGHAERKEDPTNNIVPNSSSQNRDANWGSKKFEFCENPT